jgi:hypothetical protein
MMQSSNTETQLKPHANALRLFSGIATARRLDLWLIPVARFRGGFHPLSCRYTTKLGIWCLSRKLSYFGLLEETPEILPRHRTETPSEPMTLLAAKISSAMSIRPRYVRVNSRPLDGSFL